jgi:hypothetical protein
MLRTALRCCARTAGALAFVGLLTLASQPLPAIAQGVETAVRLLAADGDSGALTVLDPDRGQIVGRFTAPTGGYSIIYPSGSGRYLVANHYAGEHVTIIDARLSLEEHGDHADLVTAPPFVLATVATGAVPAHGWAHDGLIAVHNDGDGTITLFDESEIDKTIVPREFAVAEPDHAAIATLGAAMLVGYYDLGRIDAYALDGRLLQEGITDCHGAHGEARFGDRVAFGCAEGVVTITREGNRFISHTIPYPASGLATPGAGEEAPRVGTLAAHHDSDVLVGDFGQGLALLTDVGGELTMEILPLPAEPLAFAFDHEGGRVAVLTDDGQMHGVDPEAARVLWSTPAVTPYTEIELGDGFDFYPSVAASDVAAYVADPATGEVVELRLDGGQITQRLAVGGQPARVALVMASGAGH